MLVTNRPHFRRQSEWALLRLTRHDKNTFGDFKSRWPGRKVTLRITPPPFVPKGWLTMNSVSAYIKTNTDLPPPKPEASQPVASVVEVPRDDSTRPSSPNPASQPSFFRQQHYPKARHIISLGRVTKGTGPLGGRTGPRWWDWRRCRWRCYRYRKRFERYSKTRAGLSW